MAKGRSTSLTSTKAKQSREMYWRQAGMPEEETGEATYKVWLNRIHSAFAWR
jgi:hypothetical protein